jgi:hypothetical protein
MPVKSEYAQAMEAVVASTAPLMKKSAFRKRRHTFNRSRENGVVAVLNFQMGSSDPPGTYEIPAIKDNLYGKFTVNLGIAFEEMWKIDLLSASKAFPPFLNEYECHVRLRLGQLMTPNEDAWWPLVGDLDGVGRQVAGLIERVALPWFERFDKRRAVITAWERHEPISREGRLALVVAMIYLHDGQLAQGRRTFLEYYQSPHDPHHIAWLRQLAPQIGIASLPDLPGGPGLVRTTRTGADEPVGQPLDTSDASM